MTEKLLTGDRVECPVCRRPMDVYRLTRLDEEGNPTGESFTTTGEIKFESLTQPCEEYGPGDVLGDVGGVVFCSVIETLNDDVLCDDAEAIAGTIGDLGAAVSASVIYELSARLRSYSEASRRFVEISQSFRVSPGQG